MLVAEDGVISQVGLSKKKIKPTETLVNKLSKLEKTYRKHIRDWLVSEKESKFKPVELDYEKTSKFIEEFTSEDSTKIFEDWEKVAELSMELIDRIELLKQLQPINQSITLFGVDDRPPSLFERKKWLAQVAVYENPMSVVDSLNAGVLSGLEVEALQLLYPSILEVLQSALIEGVAELQGKGIKSIGSKKMKLVNTLLQVPRLSPQKMQELQARYMQEEEGVEVEVNGNSVMTETQRVTHRNA
jgi:hypothetical protein